MTQSFLNSSTFPLLTQSFCFCFVDKSFFTVGEALQVGPLSLFSFCGTANSVASCNILASHPIAEPPFFHSYNCLSYIFPLIFVEIDFYQLLAIGTFEHFPCSISLLLNPPLVVILISNYAL